MRQRRTAGLFGEDEPVLAEGDVDLGIAAADGIGRDAVAEPAAELVGDVEPHAR